MSDYDLDPMLIQSALDQGQSLVEPTLAQLDEWSKNTIMRLLYKWDVRDNEEGERELYASEIIYPDLHNTAGYALSHLNMVMNYSWAESRSVLLGWRGGYHRPLRYKYRRDNNAMTILRTLDAVFTRNILGGSSEGTHQTFLETMVGAFKKVTVGRE